MLAGDDVGALWEFLTSAPLDVDLADRAQQPQRAAAVAPQHTEHEATRQQKGRQRDDHARDDVDIEQRVEEKRTDKYCRGVRQSGPV